MKCLHPQYKYIYITLHTDKCAFDSSEKVLLQTEKFWHCSLILVKSNANWHVLGFHCWSKVTFTINQEHISSLDVDHNQQGYHAKTGAKVLTFKFGAITEALTYKLKV